jgi:hypothetical protein
MSKFVQIIRINNTFKREVTCTPHEGKKSLKDEYGAFINIFVKAKKFVTETTLCNNEEDIVELIVEYK